MIRPALLAFTASAAIAAASPAQADTLREALAEAYQTNPTLQSARAQLRATDETVPIEKADARPNVTANANLVEVLIQNSTSFFAPARSLSLGADASVPIYSGGAVKNSIRAAKERVEAGRADLRGTESAIFSRVVAAYMDVLRGEALVGLSANQVQVLTVNLQATSDRFEIGDLTRTDVAQSQSRLALARGDLRQAQAGLIQARETYIQLVGSAPGQLEPPPPLPNLPEDPRMAVDVALDNNPDLIAARERAAAAGYDIDVAGASRLPRLSAFAGYDYQNFLGSIAGQPIDPSDPTGPSIPSPQTAQGSQAGLTLSIPLFQGGRPAALRRQAQARASSALDQVIAAERDVIAQVRGAFASYSASLAIIESSSEAVASAELSLEGVRAENSIGNRTVLDVLNAEQELLLSRVELVTARRNAYVAGFTLLAAMGRAEARDLGIEGGALYDPLVNYDRVSGKWNDWDRQSDPEAGGTRTIDIPPADAEVGDVYGPVIGRDEN